MIPISIPNLSGNEKKYLNDCIETGYVSSVGPFVARFATSVAAVSGAPYCSPVASGTAGLHIALVAAGVGRDDLVIMPSLTFIATANAAAYCGAEPWLMDVNPNSWTLDPEDLQKNLATETHQKDSQIIHTKTGRRVAAIMPVYMLGTPADMDAISRTAKNYGLPVICDAAAALGARYKDQNIGSLDVTATVFSFNGNKTFTCGGGGAVVSSDKNFTDKVNHLATTARTGENYDHDAVGYNYRMTNIQAAVGCAQLERFEDFVSAKCRIANAYRDAFKGLDHVTGFPTPVWAQSAHWLSGAFLTVDEKQIKDVLASLRKSDIDARPFWTPLHLQKPYQASPRGSLEVTEDIYKRILPLPCSTHCSDADISLSVAAVASALK